MKRVAIVLLVVSFFAGCASSPTYEQTSKKLNDGTHYFIKTQFNTLSNQSGLGNQNIDAPR